jgi:hypothetical protein
MASNPSAFTMGSKPPRGSKKACNFCKRRYDFPLKLWSRIQFSAPDGRTSPGARLNFFLKNFEVEKVSCRTRPALLWARFISCTIHDKSCDYFLIPFVSSDLKLHHSHQFVWSSSDPKAEEKFVPSFFFAFFRHLKCDGLEPSCSHCEHRNIECVYVPSPSQTDNAGDETDQGSTSSGVAELWERPTKMAKLSSTSSDSTFELTLSPLPTPQDQLVVSQGAASISSDWSSPGAHLAFFFFFSFLVVVFFSFLEPKWHLLKNHLQYTLPKCPNFFCENWVLLLPPAGIEPRPRLLPVCAAQLLEKKCETLFLAPPKSTAPKYHFSDFFHAKVQF